MTANQNLMQSLDPSHSQGVKPSILQKLSPYFFILPALLVYLSLNLGPDLVTVFFSVFEWDSFLPTTEFVGFKNFAYVLRDPIFWNALRNNIVFLILAVFVPVTIGLVFAVLISEVKIGRTFYRAVLFLPCIFSGVVIAFTWKWIYHPFLGVLNQILIFLHLPFLTQSWLGDPKVALFSCFMAYTWGSLGYSMVIYLSGLQSIDSEIYDAAMLDGVNFFQKLMWITVPMLRDVTTFVISLRILTAMGVFEVIYNMTGGGPYYASNVIGIYMYNMLRNQEMGWGTAAATINAIIVVILSIGFIQWRERNA